MTILFTGLSSVPGAAVLRKLVSLVPNADVWGTAHRNRLTAFDRRIHEVRLDLSADFTLSAVPGSIDLVVHMAAVTHARKEEDYWRVNLHGTRRLAEEAWRRGCRRFVYISTRCATADSGAYGESKLAAENVLQAMNWHSLSIIRPAEIYVGGGNEGLDKLISLARRWRIVPAIVGNRRINFAPMHIDDFATITANAIANLESGVTILELCGPNDLTSPRIAWRIARHCKAAPLPVWWPAFVLMVRIGTTFGKLSVASDQLQRLTCHKTNSATRATHKGVIEFLRD